MKKTENKETGEVSFSFTGQEIKKLKIGAIAAAGADGGGCRIRGKHLHWRLFRVFYDVPPPGEYTL